MPLFVVGESIESTVPQKLSCVQKSIQSVSICIKSREITNLEHDYLSSIHSKRKWRTGLCNSPWLSFLYTATTTCPIHNVQRPPSCNTQISLYGAGTVQKRSMRNTVLSTLFSTTNPKHSFSPYRINAPLSMARREAVKENTMLQIGPWKDVGYIFHNYLRRNSRGGFSFYDGKGSHTPTKRRSIFTKSPIWFKPSLQYQWISHRTTRQWPNWRGILRILIRPFLGSSDMSAWHLRKMFLIYFRGHS